MALSFISQIHSLFLDFDRGEFAWCADSLGIPLAGFLNAYTGLTLLSLLVGLGLTLAFRPLPVSLLVWPQDDDVARRWIVTILAVVIALPILFLGIVDATSSAFLGTPAAIVALYIVESTRSALLAQSGSQH